MKSKTEYSCGGIVYYKISNKIQILIIKDPKGNWTFPKGLVEKDEEPLDAAKREIKEETGIDKIIFRSDLGDVKYVYTFKNTFVKKTVHYFLFELIKMIKPKPQKEEGIKAAKFINFDTASQIINYPKTNGPIFIKIQDFFQTEKN